VDGSFCTDTFSFFCVDNREETRAYLVNALDGTGNGPMLIIRCDGTKGWSENPDPCSCGAWLGQNSADNVETFQLHGFPSAEDAARATYDETIKRMTLGGGSDVGTA